MTVKGIMSSWCHAVAKPLLAGTVNALSQRCSRVFRRRVVAWLSMLGDRII